jgi:hypothetical protein
MAHIGPFLRDAGGRLLLDQRSRVSGELTAHALRQTGEVAILRDEVWASDEDFARAVATRRQALIHGDLARLYNEKLTPKRFRKRARAIMQRDNAIINAARASFGEAELRTTFEAGRDADDFEGIVRNAYENNPRWLETRYDGPPPEDWPDDGEMFPF